MSLSDEQVNISRSRNDKKNKANDLEKGCNYLCGAAIIEPHHSILKGTDATVNIRQIQ